MLYYNIILENIKSLNIKINAFSFSCIRYNELKKGGIILKNCRGKETEKDPSTQTHVHEFTGSVMIAEPEEDPHNHRFVGISSEVIKVQGGHVHEISTKTDFYENHFHEIGLRTGIQIPVDNDRHIHFVEGKTTLNDGHAHNFQFSTLIEDPIGD